MDMDEEEEEEQHLLPSSFFLYYSSSSNCHNPCRNPILTGFGKSAGPFNNSANQLQNGKGCVFVNVNPPTSSSPVGVPTNAGNRKGRWMIGHWHFHPSQCPPPPFSAAAFVAKSSTVHGP
jgi:hypothetical protein